MKSNPTRTGRWETRCVARKVSSPYGEIIFRSGELVVPKFNDRAPYVFTCNELYKRGYRLDIKPLSEEEKTVEISMDEIAEKWGISKDQLRIKKE